MLRWSAHPSKRCSPSFFAQKLSGFYEKIQSIFPFGFAKSCFCAKKPRVCLFARPRGAVRLSGFSRRGVRLARARPRGVVRAGARARRGRGGQARCGAPGVNSHVTNHDHNHNQPWPSGPSGCGPSAGAARACSPRLASAAAPPLPPARLRALRPAPPVSVRFARAGLKPPLYRARVGVFGLAVGRFASGARAAFAAGALCGGCVLCGSSGDLFRLLVPRRSCASAEAALVRSGALRAPPGLRGPRGPRPPPSPSSATSAACGGEGSGAVPPSFARRFELWPPGPARFARWRTGRRIRAVTFNHPCNFSPHFQPQTSSPRL